MEKLEPEIRFPSYLGLAICLGLAAGLVEAVLIYVFQYMYWIPFDADCLGHSAELFWVCPAVDIALFALLGALAGGLARRVRPLLVADVLWWILVVMALCDWLIVILYGRIAGYALFILAAGIATTTLPWIRARRLWVLEKARSLYTKALASAVLLAIAVQGGLWLQERIAESRLPPAEPGAPNVLVIVIDTLRADHLGCYGYDRPTSPVLDSLARTGTLFENCFATASWTEPSHASMLTGRLTHDHDADMRPMDNRLPTLAEAMRDRGYRTAAFSANITYFSRRQRFGRGFLRFEDDFFSIDDALICTVFGHVLDHYFLRPFIADYVPSQKKTAGQVNGSYLRWLDADPGRPSFAFLNYMEAHEPYLLNEPYRSQFAASGAPGTNGEDDSHRSRAAVVRTENKYDACVADVDHHIGELLKNLDQRGLAKNTLVIVAADHGELFHEHGLSSHGTSLYAEVLHVPLIMRWPGHVPENLRLGTPVSLANLAATVLSLVPGGSVPGGSDPRFPAWPLSRLWQEPAIAASWPPAVAELRAKPFYSAAYPVHFGSLKALITSKWHLILNSGQPPELYDREHDPQSLQNVAGRAEFQTEFHALCEQLEKLSPGWL